MSMMMSLFSPVEALCAESIGQKLGFSFATVSKADHENRAPQPDRKAPAAAASVPTSSPFDQGIMNKGVASRSSSSSPPQPKRTTTIRHRGPRFAPELDGVFCFETIIPY